MKFSIANFIQMHFLKYPQKLYEISYNMYFKLEICYLVSSNFLFFCSMHLTALKANMVKNSLAKFLYERVFQDVVFMINRSLSASTQQHTVQANMLDIAGFGKFILKF